MRGGTKHRLFAWRSFGLSLGFFVWWFVWPLLTVLNSIPKLVILQQLWLGLPLWFWLSCVASLLLLFCFSYLWLPQDGNNQEKID